MSAGTPGEGGANDPLAPANRLAALEGMTREADEANPSAQDQQAAAVEQAKESEADAAAKQWGMLMFTVGGFAQMIAPELKAVYSEDRCFAWGQQAQAVATKYGWDGPSNMPELALLASTAGFIVPSYFLMKAKIDQAKTGTGPASWAAKMGLWWRTRRARRAGATVPPDTDTDTSEATNGGNK